MRLLRFALIACLSYLSMATSGAFATVDTNAAVVELRKSCYEENGTVLISNCFTDLPALNSWIWNTRNPQPSATSPLVVEIGPGVFTGQFTCTNKGHVTLRGAGMQNTILENVQAPIETTNCDNMVVSHMTIRNLAPGTFATRTLGGSSFWDSVEIDALGYAWIDDLSYQCASTAGKHYWFNSRLTARTTLIFAKAYYNVCDESWLFASELTAIGTAGEADVIPVFAHGGEIHVYGSVIRALTSPNVVGVLLTAAKSINDGKIHIHGTGIDVISPAANSVVVLRAENSSEIHANGSSYNLSTGTGGSVKRISKSDTGHIHAPYLWEHIPNPAVIPNFTSENGADMTTITNTPGNHPHLIIYDSGCTSHWFDATVNDCMQMNQ